MTLGFSPESKQSQKIVLATLLVAEEKYPTPRVQGEKVYSRSQFVKVTSIRADSKAGPGTGHHRGGRVCGRQKAAKQGSSKQWPAVTLFLSLISCPGYLPLGRVAVTASVGQTLIPAPHRGSVPASPALDPADSKKPL